MEAVEAEAPRQSLRFLLLYALAVAGGAVAYVPFLSLLLPLRVMAMTDSGHVAWLGCSPSPPRSVRWPARW